MGGSRRVVIDMTIGLWKRLTPVCWAYGCVSRLCVFLSLCVCVFCIKSAYCMYTVSLCVCEVCHLGPMWCHVSTSWQRHARLCIKWSLSACELDWVGESVGVYVFSSDVSVCYCETGSTLKLLMWQYGSLESFLPFSTTSLSISHCLALLFLTSCSSFFPSPLCSCFSPLPLKMEEHATNVLRKILAFGMFMVLAIKE